MDKELAKEKGKSKEKRVREDKVYEEVFQGGGFSYCFQQYSEEE